jgi:hypothetical protein
MAHNIPQITNFRRADGVLSCRNFCYLFYSYISYRVMTTLCGEIQMSYVDWTCHFERCSRRLRYRFFAQLHSFYSLRLFGVNIYLTGRYCPSSFVCWSLFFGLWYSSPLVYRAIISLGHPAPRYARDPMHMANGIGASRQVATFFYLLVPGDPRCNRDTWINFCPRDAENCVAAIGTRIVRSKHTLPVNNMRVSFCVSRTLFSPWTLEKVGNPDGIGIVRK